MRTTSCFLWTVLLLTSVVSPALAAVGGGQLIYDLGTLGGTYSGGFAVNDAGQVAGQSYLSGDTALHAFRYDGTPGSGGVMRDLGTLGGTNGIGYAINAAGQVAGSSNRTGNVISHVFRYDGTPGSGGVMRDLLTLGGTHSFGYGVNDAGAVAGTSAITDDAGYHAFRYDGTPGAGGIMRDLGTLGGTYSDGIDVNNAGAVTGEGAIAGDAGYHAFRYDGTPGSGGVMRDLGTLGGTYSYGYGINDAGQVAGNSEIITGDTATHAFRYDGTPGAGGIMRDLGTLGGTYGCVGFAINDAGQVVGTSYTTDNAAVHAFLYNGTPGSGGQMIDLDTWLDANNPTAGAKWTLVDARSISNAGWITGTGYYDPDGPGDADPVTRAYMLDASSTVPEPATIVLFGVALAAMLGSLSQRSNSRQTGRRTNHRHAVRRPSFEPLEDRRLLSFTPAVSYPVRSAPYSVVTADFNNDGRLDLATANVYGNDISILLGKGDGAFQASQNYATWEGPDSIAVGDFNADGKLDLVAGVMGDASEDGAVTVLLGNGDGSFEWFQDIYTGGCTPQAVAVGDYDTDGNLDVAVTGAGLNNASDLTVLLGDGNGSFAARSNYFFSGDYAPSIAVGDFNRDGKVDLALANLDDAAVDVLLSNGHGTFQVPQSFSTAGNPSSVAVADLNGDDKIDLVTSNARGDGANVLLGYGDGTFQGARAYVGWGGFVGDFNGDGSLDLFVGNNLVPGEGHDAAQFPAGGGPTTLGDFNGDGRWEMAWANFPANSVSVVLNDGNWPATIPTLPGDYNGNGEVDAADYVVWRKTLGSSVTNYSGADGSGNGVVDQDDQSVWRAHFGETLPAVGAGSLVAAANTATPELSASVVSVVVTEQASASVEPAEPDERGSIEPQGTSARDAALAVLDSWLPQFVPQGKATMRRLHALPTTDSGMKARGNDLLLVRSSAAEFNQQPSERALNAQSINDSTEEAMETRREALDIAFTTLEHAARQLGGNMLRRVWAGLWFAFVLFLGAHANAVPVVIYSNFGPGDSVKNSVHDVLNQLGYAEHAARFFVPMGTNFTFTGIDVPIQDALAENERIESQLSIRLWTDNAGQPGTLLESMAADVVQLPPGYLIQHVDSTSNTTLLQNNYYWISLAAINPGRVGWFVNNTETGGYALKWPTSGATWLVIDTASAGAFRVFGEAAPVPEPSTAILFAAGLAVLGLRARREYRPIASRTKFERENRPCRSTVGC